MLMAERAHPVNMRADGEGPGDRRDPRRRQRSDRRIPLLLALVAATLAVMASVHLAGLLQGSNPFRPDDAGIAEAVIGAALLVGAAALWRQTAHRWGLAVAATGFAIVGFVVGLSFTLRGGDAIDVAYHATMLPVLLLALAALVRKKEHTS
jgi:drug/metabolite transporter (DMT)-like permease